MKRLYFPFLNKSTATAFELLKTNEISEKREKGKQRKHKTTTNITHLSHKMSGSFVHQELFKREQNHFLKKEPKNIKQQGGEADSKRIHTAVLNGSTVHTFRVTVCSHPADGLESGGREAVSVTA